jgi:hypothetical protein
MLCVDSNRIRRDIYLFFFPFGTAALGCQSWRPSFEYLQLSLSLVSCQSSSGPKKVRIPHDEECLFKENIYLFSLGALADWNGRWKSGGRAA